MNRVNFRMIRKKIRICSLLPYFLGGKISGRSLEIEAQAFTVKDSASVSVDHGGYPKTQGSGYGPTDMGAKASCGGSHAGYGSCPSSLSNGSPYGNMFQPSVSGSGGGGLSAVNGGGEGGGIVKITSVNLQIDGIISARYVFLVYK